MPINCYFPKPNTFIFKVLQYYNNVHLSRRVGILQYKPADTPTAKELSIKLGCSLSTVSAHIKTLYLNGFLEKMKTGKCYRNYEITEKGLNYIFKMTLPVAS